MNGNIQTVVNAVSKTAGRVGLRISKNSPQILLGLGIAGIIGGTILACKATLKVDEVTHQFNSDMTKIKEASETFEESEYSEEDHIRDLAVVYTRTAIKFATLYGPALAATVFGVGCILGSHNILSKRNTALMAAYEVVQGAFAKYRRNVVNELGEEKDRVFKYGSVKTEVLEEVVVDGKEKVVKKKRDVFDPNEVSEYAKIFDKLSPQWQNNAEYNLMFLRTQQNYMNDMLTIRGHVFLNEVYDALGIPRTSAGSIVGWVKNGDGDGFITFGLYDNASDSTRNFVNGYDESVLLDFNVDGVIWDLI